MKNLFVIGLLSMSMTLFASSVGERTHLVNWELDSTQENCLRFMYLSESNGLLVVTLAEKEGRPRQIWMYNRGHSIQRSDEDKSFVKVIDSENELRNDFFKKRILGKEWIGTVSLSLSDSDEAITVSQSYKDSAESICIYKRALF